MNVSEKRKFLMFTCFEIEIPNDLEILYVTYTYKLGSLCCLDSAHHLRYVAPVIDDTEICLFAHC